jgi:UDP-N-acetylglucosamine 3-dehydrogenase
MKSERLRVAVIGVGNMGRHHVRNYDELDRVDLVAIADLNKDLGRLMAQKHHCEYYKDYRHMLDTEKIDAVTVAVPSKFHHEVGLEVIRRGLHVLLEKPIAMTEVEAKALIKAATRSGVNLMIGHIERFNPVVVELKELIESGRLGRIVSIIARRVGIMPPQITDANVIVDLGVHDIDIISYLLGVYPDRVFANGGRALLNHREDYADIFLNYGDITGVVQVNWVTPVRVRNLAITGTEGYAEVDYLTQKLTVYRSVIEEKLTDGFGEFLIRYGSPEKEDIEVEKKEPLRAEIESFVESIISGIPIVTTGEDGLKALQVALKAGDDISGRAV